MSETMRWLSDPMPRWRHRLHLGDIFHDDALPFTDKRDEIVRRIRSAPWYDGDSFRLLDAVDGLAGAEDGDEFDGFWDEFYDWCDYKRIWVDTIRARPTPDGAPPEEQE